LKLDIINSRKNSRNSLQFLKRLEKLALGRRIRNQQDRIIFRSYLKANFSSQEINMMLTEIELNQNKWNEYLKLLFSFGVAFVTVICSFFAVISVTQYSLDLQLAIKLAEQKEGFELIGIREFFNTLKGIWVFLASIVIGVSYVSFILLPKRKILFLSILKSIEE
jgi:hypothetical protein